MAAVLVAGEEEPTKACRICAEQIKVTARKCIKCNSWQDLRGELFQFGTTSLTLLVALVSVIATGEPALRRLMVPQTSKLEFSYQGNSAQYLTILGTDSGGRPGSVRRAELYLPDRLGRGIWQMNLSVVTPDSSGAVLISSESSKLFRLTPNGIPGHRLNHAWLSYTPNELREEFNFAADPYGQSTCRVRYLFSNFDGTPDDQWRQPLCVSLRTFLTAYAMSPAK